MYFISHLGLLYMPLQVCDSAMYFFLLTGRTMLIFYKIWVNNSTPFYSWNKKNPTKCTKSQLLRHYSMDKYTLSWLLPVREIWPCVSSASPCTFVTSWMWSLSADGDVCRHASREQKGVFRPQLRKWNLLPNSKGLKRCLTAVDLR